MGYGFDVWIKPRVESSPWYLPMQTTAWAGYGVCMWLFFRVTAADFVYFQF